MASNTITLEKAQEFFDAWEKAYLAVSTGTSYTFSSGGSSRTLTRGNINEIREQMQYWASVIDRKNGLRRRVKFATPRDDSLRHVHYLGGC